MDLDSFVFYRRLNKSRHDHPILPRLARPDGIEEAGDDDLQLGLFEVGKSEKFVECFGTCICPAVLVGRTCQ